MLSHLGALGVSALVFLLVAGFALKTFSSLDGPRWARILAGCAALGALGLSAAFVLPLLVPPTPTVSVSLSSDSPRQPLGELSGDFILGVRGQLPPLREGQTVQAHYHLTLLRGAETVEKIDGVLEEHWGRQRVAGRGSGTMPVAVVHTERQHALAPLDGGALELRLDELDAALDGPLEVSVRRRPLTPRTLLAALAVLVLLAALSDVARGKESYAAVAVAGVGGFALLLNETQPPVSFGSVSTMAMIAGVAALVLGGLARLLARRVWTFVSRRPAAGLPGQQVADAD